MSPMNDLVDALYGQVELVSQRFKRYAQGMASADKVIPSLSTERLFQRHGVGV